jgi:4-alpha-glucanotransferase
MTVKRRSAGILLHPTSLPGRYGIGDLGPAAIAWVESLAKAKQTWWQMLPLGPTGYGDSPYQSYSAFAGNPNLISPDFLVRDGLLSAGDLKSVNFAADAVDYENVNKFKGWILDRAWAAFRKGTASHLKSDYERFCRDEASWLDDYALFMALKSAHDLRPWHEWSAPLRRRDPKALEAARKEHTDAIGQHRFRQFLFFRQLDALRQHAHKLGVKLIGDAPIFVAADSADVWAHPELFLLDADRKPKFVAGVPPDYFSATGQLWGNPLYDWSALKAQNYAWWVARLRATLRQVDLVRLDHFRGFEAAWNIPFGTPTAETGVWVKGPAVDFFQTLKRELGDLPLIAEDLGLISDEVHALRDHFGLPGMCILQFAYGGAVEFRFLPHNHVRNAFIYTGTHDNDTTRGWWHTLNDAERTLLRRYMPHVDEDPVWWLIRTAWGSVADFAVIPLQDMLDLGTEARMNVPGVASGNWRWRVREEQLSPAVFERLADLTYLYNRHPEPQENAK